MMVKNEDYDPELDEIFARLYVSGKTIKQEVAKKNIVDFICQLWEEDFWGLYGEDISVPQKKCKLLMDSYAEFKKVFWFADECLLDSLFSPLDRSTMIPEFGRVYKRDWDCVKNRNSMIATEVDMAYCEFKKEKERLVEKYFGQELTIKEKFLGYVYGSYTYLGISVGYDLTPIDVVNDPKYLIPYPNGYTLKNVADYYIELTGGKENGDKFYNRLKKYVKKSLFYSSAKDTDTNEYRFEDPLEVLAMYFYYSKKNHDESKDIALLNEMVNDPWYPNFGSSDVTETIYRKEAFRERCFCARVFPLKDYLAAFSLLYKQWEDEQSDIYAVYNIDFHRDVYIAFGEMFLEIVERLAKICYSYLLSDVDLKKKK